MQSKMKSLIGAIACLAIAIPVFAQYGHPLKGSWSGDWWLVKGKENHILLDFNFVSSGYGNTTLTGILNPGPDQSPMQNLTLTPPDVISAGKAAIAARDAALAKQAAEAAAGTANPAPAPSVTAAPEAKPVLLVMGSTGDNVTALQKKLGDAGFATGETDTHASNEKGARRSRVPAPRRSSVHGRHCDVPPLRMHPTDNRLPTYKPCGG